MVTFKDLITGDISDSPSDRLAAPILLGLTFPVVIPCSIVYHSVKGVQALKDRIEYREIYKKIKEMEQLDETTIETQEPVIEPAQTKKAKVLSLRNNNEKQM